MRDGVQERLLFVAEHIGILPYGFDGNASHWNLGSQNKQELLDTAVWYGYDEGKTFEEMFGELMNPMGLTIGTSCVISVYYECERHDYEFITVRRGYEHLATVKPESQWSPWMRTKRPRCGLCERRSECEFFKAGLLKPKKIV